MEGMAKRQPEIDSVCKPKLITRAPVTKGKPGSRLRSVTPGYDIIAFIAAYPDTICCFWNESMFL